MYRECVPIITQTFLKVIEELGNRLQTLRQRAFVYFKENRKMVIHISNSYYTNHLSIHEYLPSLAEKQDEPSESVYISIEVKKVLT
jgi:hypothetical protein